MIRVVPLYPLIEHMQDTSWLNFYHQNHKVCRVKYNFWKSKIQKNERKLVITFYGTCFGLWQFTLKHIRSQGITLLHLFCQGLNKRKSIEPMILIFFVFVFVLINKILFNELFNSSVDWLLLCFVLSKAYHCCCCADGISEQVSNFHIHKSNKSNLIIAIATKLCNQSS